MTAFSMAARHAVMLHARLRLAAEAMGLNVNEIRVTDMDEDTQQRLLDEAEQDWLRFINDDD